MPKYSIIVPVYNRPNEIDELLNSLVDQTYQEFEVIIVEDGSDKPSEKIISNYNNLDIKYFFKENTGQGFSRNFGSEHAQGEWLVFFDSDCIIPPNYLENLDGLTSKTVVEAFCGPDSARDDFSTLQKAISYSMTSFLTTGGIRGREKKIDSEAHLRSYNLVMQKQVFKSLNGFAKTNMGEDMELSNRFQLSGHKALINQKLEVYHKRRNSLKSFFMQVFSFGRTRIQLRRMYGIAIKLPHIFPTLFTLGFLLIGVGFIISHQYASALAVIYSGYFFMILLHSSITNRSLKVGLLSIITSFIQHCGYGLGFIKESISPKHS
ncbi:glycosyltransferase [Ekhidna sp. To15]|uniref:glycosyltransferase n=1 Tax=Ekhidna sp. To15 TaxID=3395267 RepID=UPI003F524533